MMLDVCTKFLENISQDYRVTYVRSIHDFHTEIYEGAQLHKNCQLSWGSCSLLYFISVPSSVTVSQRFLVIDLNIRVDTRMVENVEDEGRNEKTDEWMIGWLYGWFWFNGPLRQYFSLYRVVSQREGERGEKGWLVVLGLTAL